MDKVTARGSDSSPGRGRTIYHKDIITLHIHVNSISLKLSKVNVTGESEQSLNIAMSPFTHHYHNFSPLVPTFLIILVLYWSRSYTQNHAILKKCTQIVNMNPLDVKLLNLQWKKSFSFLSFKLCNNSLCVRPCKLFFSFWYYWTSDFKKNKIKYKIFVTVSGCFIERSNFFF